MLVLGIETSCDETAAAVVEDGERILSNVVASQVDLHKEFGGVVPEIACRAHIEMLPGIVQKAMDEAGVGFEDIDLIAATQGPGLIGALMIGFTMAKGMASALDKPFVGVNHIEAHIYAAFMEHEDIELPAVGLVVSGGHTLLVHIEHIGKYEVLGQTRDDAAGEAFDKVAKLLGLPYPGGPVIDRLAKKVEGSQIRFPRAKFKGNQLDFSFSGIKTAVAHYLRDNPQARVEEVAWAFQEAVVGMLVGRLLEGMRKLGVSCAIVGGGVAQNSRLRKLLLEEVKGVGGKIFIPEPKMCMDNGAMIAGLGWEIYMRTGKGTPLDEDAYPDLPISSWGD